MSAATEATLPEGHVGPPVSLTEHHLEALSKQDSRRLTEFQAQKFRATAQKQWDLFYKRNEDRFFKVRVQSITSPIF
jgi:hypothetical protein